MTDAAIVERIRGVRIETGAHRPFLMDDAARVHFVERGHLDVFAVELSAGEVAGRRRFVARVAAGEMAFGASPIERAERAFGLLAVPSRDAVVVRGERDGVASESFDLAATHWVDEWIARLSEFLVRDRPPHRDALLLEADPDIPYASGSVVSAQHRDVIWVSATTAMRFMGRRDTTVAEGEPLLPITERTWFTIDADARVSAVYTPTALLTSRLWPGLDRFSTRVLELAVLAEAETVEASRTQRRDAHQARRAAVAGALRGFGEILGATGDDGLAGATSRRPLHMAAGLVAASCGVSLEVPDRSKDVRDPVETIEALARSAGARTRWITLAPGWWRRDGPSVLGFTNGREGPRRPLALLADGRGRYRAADPLTGSEYGVNERAAGGVAAGGLAFYAPLPDHVAGGGAALRFAMHRRWRDLRTLLAVGVLGGLAALLAPILTGEILVRIMPRGDIPLWIAAIGALTLVAFGNAVFEIVRGLSLLRIEGRVDERLQSAIWSRLISLPAPFFRDFTAGDLADRANGIGEIRKMLTGAAVQAAMGGIFSVFSLALLFHYSWVVASWVSALLLVLVGATWALSRGQLRHYREAFHVQGALNGFVFQMISGLAKLRVAHAENHMLARWAQRFAAQKRENLAALRWAAGQHVVGGMFQPVSLIVVFASVHQVLMRGDASFSLAAFLSFNAALGQLTAAVTALTAAATTVMGVIPLFERVRPILETRPETADGGIDPGDLKGDIEFANVTFRYAAEGPNAIDGISFHIGQGDYVAFVGPSGCGKSTIYRLLLGFERPDSGTVFLDRHDLASLDLTEVRRRLGVVLQNGQLVAGSIFENIAGMSPLNADEAWAAARAAAIEDDIRAMPMGMRTMLPEGGVGLSTGQKQRLLIARALARKPRVILFDEATSALDNRAQAMVQASIERLGVTRVVIAHRLSSIRDVDRIYVLEAGRIVESGRYDQLMKRDGVFAALARRQLVEA